MKTQTEAEVSLIELVLEAMEIIEGGSICVPDDNKLCGGTGPTFPGSPFPPINPWF